MVSPIFSVALSLALFLIGFQTLHAQAPAPAPAKTAVLLANGGFESSFRSNLLWNGVDSSGNLAGDRFATPVLTLSGTIAEQSMPISVLVRDMNADKLQDIVAMDAVGYLRIWFNSGTPTEPKFTIGEIASVFLTRNNIRSTGGATGALPLYARMAPRIAASDPSVQGRNDFFVGNYMGEVLFLKNEGSALKPDFKQPQDPGKLEIPTTKGNAAKWGNLFAPAVWDWNNDGRMDLLLGEGSYSANNIHLLINTGSTAQPAFDESNRSVLAFGDGREQLSVCVVDYNGDGKPDLLVTDRTGKVALYLNKLDKWKPGDEVPFASYVNAGTTPLSGGGISTISTGDMNGDGLFDVVIGKANGRIALALNSGTKTDPKFGALTELKGAGPGPAAKMPSGWEVNFGLQRGNFYGYTSVVTEGEEPGLAPPEGKAAFKIGYLPCPNVVMAQPNPSQFSGALSPDFDKTASAPGSKDDSLARLAPANWFLLSNSNARVKTDQKYTLSFKIKGSGVNNAALSIDIRGSRKLGEDVVKRASDRGEATIVNRNVVDDTIRDRVAISPGATWTEVSRPIDIKFRAKELSDPSTIVTMALDFTGTLQPMKGEFYIDDVKLTPR